MLSRSAALLWPMKVAPMRKTTQAAKLAAVSAVHDDLVRDPFQSESSPTGHRLARRTA